MNRPDPSTASLGFMTIWLLGWSLAVGFLSNLVATEGGALWLFMFTHGGAEVVVGWSLAKSFALAAERTISAPSISMDLATMTARWRAKPRLLWLLVWFIGLGLIVGVMLALGTWTPVIDDPSAVRIAIAVFLSVGWGIIGWRWAKTLRVMLGTFAVVDLSATFDRVEIARRRGPWKTVTTLPTAALRVTSDGQQVTLHSGADSISLKCPRSPERTQMLATLREVAARTRAAPFEQPPIPEALTALRTSEPP